MSRKRPITTMTRMRALLSADTDAGIGDSNPAAVTFLALDAADLRNGWITPDAAVANLVALSRGALAVEDADVMLRYAVTLPDIKPGDCFTQPALPTVDRFLSVAF
ncbi:hypothetical protein [Planomonospora sp. ID82291]|uniref:hypothetical protein n=1 Tax=Planomonospora sp. ID82291 TaxID=2738136 RepID=UPI0018C413FB|nr:hypothetical protein [Planomonospora sp. ID82291]MBG0818299.1 hypothetical protein [Planomonospora sp. ID82291]